MIMPKKRGSGLDIQTFKGKAATYVVFRAPNGSFYAFVETDAKKAALDCGSKLPPNSNTRSHWRELWKTAPQSK